MTNYKRGQHPRSRANLGKPKTKAGRFNFTLSEQSAEWLSKQPNKSAAIDQLIEKEVMSTHLGSPVNVDGQAESAIDFGSDAHDGQD